MFLYQVTPLDLARNLLGRSEIPGEKDDSLIMAMLKWDNAWPEHDEVPWCSSLPNFVFAVLGLDALRTKSLRARSWLKVGRIVPLAEAKPGWDLLVFKQEGGPGPDVIEAPGHVGFYTAHAGDKVWCLGGNQSNAITVAAFPIHRLLGVVRTVG